MDMSVRIIMALALAFYTVGVWGERFQGRLLVWHTILFCAGLICDTWGTGMMFDSAGGMLWDIHGISGVAAIALMGIHAAWAIIVLIRKNEAMKKKFHRFSIFVWIVWLIPYLSPMFLHIFA